MSKMITTHIFEYPRESQMGDFEHGIFDEPVMTEVERLETIVLLDRLARFAGPESVSATLARWHRELLTSAGLA